jgi:tripartite-type tricarboxylate transporter receptor subunit TctC
MYAVLVLAAYATPSGAQEYPVRAVRFVAPFAAGGGADINVRRLGERLNKLWGQPVIVENIAGAGGGVAAVNVAKSRPDGYTLFFVTHPILAINPALYDKLPYDPENDFAAIVHVSDAPTVLLVNPSLQATKVSDLVSLAKARPGALNYGTGGVGTSLHLAAELFKAATGTDIAHVPYKGTTPALTALLSNDIQMMFDSSASALQRMQSGRVRGIAVASMTRLSAAPALPTFDESGVRNFVVTLAYGVMAPAGMPPALIATINRDLNTVLSDPEYRTQMADGGADVIGGSPEQFRKFLAAERRKWGALIQKLGIKGM